MSSMSLLIIISSGPKPHTESLFHFIQQCFYAIILFVMMIVCDDLSRDNDATATIVVNKCSCRFLMSLLFTLYPSETTSEFLIKSPFDNRIFYSLSRSLYPVLHCTHIIQHTYRATIEIIAMAIQPLQATDADVNVIVNVNVNVFKQLN